MTENLNLANGTRLDYLIEGDGDAVENLQALCAPCNLRKGSRFIG